MTFMCAWCDERIKEFGGKPGIAHGICPDCRAKYFPETLRTVRENGKVILMDCLRAIGRNGAALIFLLALLSAPCFAGPDPSILPDKPQPQPSGKIRNAEDREFWIEAGALGSAWTLDAISTHDSFAAKSSRYEIGGFFNGSRSVPKIMGAWAAVDVGAVVVSYEWKKHVRNRYLHPLWRVPLIVGTVGHDHAAVANWTLGK